MQRRPVAPCLSIILEVRPVGRADLDEVGPGALHDVGEPDDPPISISSPRETMVSLPPARVSSVRRTAAAFSLTTQASSAPFSSQIRPRT